MKKCAFRTRGSGTRCAGKKCSRVWRLCCHHWDNRERNKAGVGESRRRHQGDVPLPPRAAVPFSPLHLSTPNPARWCSAPLLPDTGLHTPTASWEVQTWGARGDREAASICLLLGSVLMPFALPCSSACAASCGTWEDVTHGVCCPAQNKGTAA